MRDRRLYAGMLLLGVALTSTSLQNGSAQQSPFRYLNFMQRLRRAASSLQQERQPGQRRDENAVVALIQSEGYPQAIAQAVKRGRDEDLLELYRAKFGTHWPSAVEGTPLLSFAAMNRDVDVVRLLLARGGDARAANEEKWTPLHYAAEESSVAITQILLDKGADVNAGTARFGETPLMLTCGLYDGGRTTERGSGLDCARLLLKRGAQVNAATKDGQTALMFAAHAGRVDTVRLLLAQGADAARKDFKGRDALADVLEFENIEADGKITLTQDSVSVPTYKVTVFDDLIRHGKALPGRYVSPDAERKTENDGLQDFLTIIRLLRAAEAAHP